MGCAGEGKIWGRCVEFGKIFDISVIANPEGTSPKTYVGGSRQEQSNKKHYHNNEETDLKWVINLNPLTSISFVSFPLFTFPYETNY